MIAAAAQRTRGTGFKESLEVVTRADAGIEVGGAEPGRPQKRREKALTDSRGSRAAAGGKEQTTGKAGRHRFVCDRVLSSH